MALARIVVAGIHLADDVHAGRLQRRNRRLDATPNDTRRAAASLIVALVIATTSITHAASPETSCDLAALKAEHDWNLPAGILSAVGTIESGRAGRGGVAPWPWTINAAGRGGYYESKGDAVATVLTIMERGFPYIDVGCFQVDIAYHAGVFRSLEDAFDPDRNAQAAARILLANRTNAPDWSTAIARYHSATPELGGPYLRRVRDALPAATIRALSAQAQGAAFPIASPVLPPSAKLPIVIYGLPLGENPQRPPRLLGHIAHNR